MSWPYICQFTCWKWRCALPYSHLCTSSHLLKFILHCFWAVEIAYINARSQCAPLPTPVEGTVGVGTSLRLQLPPKIDDFQGIFKCTEVLLGCNLTVPARDGRTIPFVLNPFQWVLLGLRVEFYFLLYIFFVHLLIVCYYDTHIGHNIMQCCWLV